MFVHVSLDCATANSDKLERHCTFADREMAILFKLTAFQILNTVLPSMIFASRSGDHLFSEFGAPNGTFVAELAGARLGRRDRRVGASSGSCASLTLARAS